MAGAAGGRLGGGGGGGGSGSRWLRLALAARDGKMAAARHPHPGTADGGGARRARGGGGGARPGGGAAPHLPQLGEPRSPRIRPQPSGPPHASASPASGLEDAREPQATSSSTRETRKPQAWLFRDKMGPDEPPIL
ncbi:uncharacterized protein [Vulpes vulpes]|uniref:Uncharacterized protein isoform X2 n=1 Tax=Vulpes vulpes TaxID=9627 RepID=A0ABM4Y7Y6_VULVU